jgi:hypothetical protein
MRSATAKTLRVVCSSYAAWSTWCLGYPEQALQRKNDMVTLPGSCLILLAWLLLSALRPRSINSAARDRQPKNRQK